MPEGGYRFEPLQRGGLALGLSAGQIGLLAGAMVVAFAVVRTLPGGSGWATATVVLALAGAGCRPVQGRSLLQWARIAASFVSKPKRRVLAPPAAAQQWGSPPDERRCQVGAGRPRAPDKELRWQPLPLPKETFVPGIYLLEAALDGTGPVGVLLDEPSGTAAGLLRARGGAFCLLDKPDKELREAAWAGVLESFCNQQSALVRLQWCHRAVPASVGEPSVDQGWRDLRRSSWHHETFLVVVVRAPARRRPGPRRVPSQVASQLGNEIAGLRVQLHALGVACDGPLDARGCAAALGGALVPDLARHPGAHPWPLCTEERWGEVRADGYWHRVYWAAEWPRSSVGPDFLTPLLVSRSQRCFSVVMAPIPAEKAARDTESSRTAQIADAKLRAQGGFLETARQRRRAEALEGREAELADGRGAYRFAGYVAVSAPSKAALDRSCGELERAAGSARLCLRPLYGQQKDALGWALPFGRGV
jgi:hypothetical protein